MAFMDRFKKFYEVPCRCYNCGFMQTCKIPKGNTIDSWLKTADALCSNCGNPTLRRIERVSAPADIQKPIQQRVSVNPPQRNLKSVVQPHFLLPPSSNQRSNPSGYQTTSRPRPPTSTAQRVEYPVTEPVQPQEDQSVPKKINFWTGKEE